jgi:hypothetical protein
MLTMEVVVGRRLHLWDCEFPTAPRPSPKFSSPIMDCVILGLFAHFSGHSACRWSRFPTIIEFSVVVLSRCQGFLPSPIHHLVTVNYYLGMAHTPPWLKTKTKNQDLECLMLNQLSAASAHVQHTQAGIYSAKEAHGTTPMCLRDCMTLHLTL